MSLSLVFHVILGSSVHVSLNNRSKLLGCTEGPTGLVLMVPLPHTKSLHARL
jgi:hypothetical protein